MAKKPATKSAKKSPVSKRATASEVPVKHEGGSLHSLIDFNFQDIEKLFQDFFIRSPWRAPNWGLPGLEEMRETMKNRLPNVDVVDKRKEVLVRAELPGCEKDDIEITLANGNIKIAAQHRDETEEKDDNYLRKEISSREYLRTIPAPAGVDVSKATAEMKGGVLRIHFPKTGEKKPKRLSIG